MPKTVSLHPDIIPRAITATRLDSYRSVFSVTSEHELVGCYLWNLNVCSGLYPLLSSLETTVRNSIDQALAAHLGRFWWSRSRLRYKSFVPGGPVPKPVEKVRENFSRAALGVKTDRRRRYPHLPATAPLHDEVVAKTDFSTWEFLLDHEFMGPGLIWPSKLGSVLKGTWPSSKASVTLTHAQALVRNAREFRNRVSHHEPVWKRYGVLTETDALAHLNEKIDAIEGAVALFSPDKLLFLQKNRILSTARRLCTRQELDRVKRDGPELSVKTMARLQSLLARPEQGGGALVIRMYSPRKRRFLIIPE